MQWRRAARNYRDRSCNPKVLLCSFSAMAAIHVSQRRKPKASDFEKNSAPWREKLISESDGWEWWPGGVLYLESSGRRRRKSQRKKLRSFQIVVFLYSLYDYWFMTITLIVTSPESLVNITLPFLQSNNKILFDDKILFIFTFFYYHILKIYK